MNEGLNYGKKMETLGTKILGGCHKEDSSPEYTNIGVQTQDKGNCEKSKRETWVRKTQIRNLN